MQWKKESKCCYFVSVFMCTRQNGHRDKLSDDRRFCRETDGYNENCLGVRFALCINKALRLARIEHCSGTVVTPFLLSVFIEIIIYLRSKNPKRI